VSYWIGLVFMGRILLVDDTMFAKQLLNLILTSDGHEIVGEANDGIEGIEQYKKLRPDLVLMDMIMPRMGGMECLMEIMKFDTNAKILIVSADMQDKHVRETIKGGSLGYIKKPFKKETVLEEVNLILNNSGPRAS
jgi:two-component system, chemotaxis family, chemotaxis protein CheY